MTTRLQAEEAVTAGRSHCFAAAPTARDVRSEHSQMTPRRINVKKKTLHLALQQRLWCSSRPPPPLPATMTTMKQATGSTKDS
jgi:hypothetical protein